MTGHDDEFDDFLARKRPLFRRPADDQVEPPDTVDRMVLRQARDAIKPQQPERVYRGPGWAAPMAVAATLLVCLSLALHVVLPQKAAKPATATQQVAQRIEAESAAPVPNNSASRTEAAERYSPAPPPPPATAVARADSEAPAATTDSMTSTAADASAAAPSSRAAPAAGAQAAPVWRGDARTWLAEIDRLRAAGKSAEADAEMAEYKRQHRAYAGTPDR